MNLEDIIRKSLKDRVPKTINDNNGQYRQAAVLIPLFKSNGEYKAVFTKRTNKVDDHKGQISFPGGGIEEQDSTYEDTALRESYEEIGLLREDVTVLGRLDDTLTLASNFIIHPVIGMIPHPYDYQISQDEVDRIIEAPLSLFYPKEPGSNMGNVEYGGITYHGLSYSYRGDVIWGATAKIMRDFIKILGKIDLPEGNE